MSDKNDKNDKISEMIKKVVSIGVGAAFMTEDAVKNILGDIPLPKDIVSGLVQNAKKSKEDFSESMREEFKNYLGKVEPMNIIDELIARYDIEVNASFKFKKKDKSKD